jgi:hypothetical protein
MTKVSDNFDIREFVSKETFDRYGVNATWFVRKQTIDTAEFYKSFFTDYYKKKLGANKVASVSIVVNNWHFGGGKQFSGYRPPSYTEGAKESQHRAFNAFDCEIWVVFTDGKRQEVDYVEVHRVIMQNEALFLSKGITCIEDVRDATGWLHTDFRYIPNQTKLLVVRA